MEQQEEFLKIEGTKEAVNKLFMKIQCMPDPCMDTDCWICIATYLNVPMSITTNGVERVYYPIKD